MELSESSILVISDSHGSIPTLIAALEWAKNSGITEAVFLGDGIDDLALASARTGFTLPWHTVRGNGDYQFTIPGSMVLALPCGRKLFLSHGHYYNIWRDYTSIVANARNAGAEAALFGHTHIPYSGTVDGIFLLNPGSIGRPRSDTGCTFAVLHCPDSNSDHPELSARFFSLAKQDNKHIVTQ